MRKPTVRRSDYAGLERKLELSPSAPTLIWRRAGLFAGLSALLVLLVLLAFGQSTGYGFFNYDDDQYVQHNRYINPGVTLRGLQWVMSNHHVGNFHPVTSLSHMLDCQWFGVTEGAGGHHATNLAFHAAAAIALLGIVWKLTGGPWLGALVAAVFAAHPLRVESVVWVSSRKDVLSGFFFMLTLLAYLAYTRRPSVGRYILIVLPFVLGLLSKPMLVTLPIVLLLLDRWPLGRMEHVSWGRLWAEKTPLLALSLAQGVATLFTQQITMETLDKLPLHCRVGNALVAVATYAGQLFCPSELAPYYPHPRESLSVWVAIVAGGLLVAISVMVWRWRARFPYLLMGWAWYLVMLLPVVGLIQVGGQARADRYTYLPMIGITLALAVGVRQYLAGKSLEVRMTAAAMAMVIVGALTWGASAQTEIWRDNEVLWRHTLACTANNYIAHVNLAGILAERGRFDEAYPHFRRTVELAPRSPLALVNLGIALRVRGEYTESMRILEKAKEIDPNASLVYYNIGNTLAAQRRSQDSIKQFREAIKFDPDFAAAHNNLGVSLVECGGVQEGIDCYHRALALKPDYVDAMNNLGNALHMQGRYGEAIAQYQQTLRYQPRHAIAWFYLGNSYLMNQQVDQAIESYQKALHYDPKLADASNNLQVLLQRKATGDAAILRSVPRRTP